MADPQDRPGTPLEAPEEPGPAAPPWARGSVFKNGKLYIFQARRVLVARAWPDLRAWVKTPTRPWRPTCRSVDRVVMGSLFPPGGPARSQAPVDPLEDPVSAWWRRIQEREDAVLGQFFDAIPAEVRLTVLPFPEKRWHLLNLIARCEGGLDLCRANPALAFALSCNRAFHSPGVQRPYRAARSLLPKPQRAIQAWLGFPATEQVRRILHKIEPSALTVPRLLALRKHLEDPALLKLLAHLPRIHAGVLHVATIPRYGALLTPAFLGDLVAWGPDQPWGEILARPLWDAEACCRVLHVPFDLPACRSLTALHAYHQRLAGSMERASISEYPPMLPVPPFPGTAGLEPITTSAELQRESIEMGHCVVSHIDSVQAGLEAVYRVLAPLRATLSVVRTGGGWRPGQVSGPYNAAVPRDVKDRLFSSLMFSAQAR